MGELLLYFQVNVIIVEEVSRPETQPETEMLTSFDVNSFGKRNPQGLCLSQGQVTSSLHSVVLLHVFFNQMKTMILRRTSEIRRNSLKHIILWYTNFRSSNSSTHKGKDVRAGLKCQANFFIYDV